VLRSPRLAEQRRRRGHTRAYRQTDAQTHGHLVMTQQWHSSRAAVHAAAIGRQRMTSLQSTCEYHYVQPIAGTLCLPPPAPPARLTESLSSSLSLIVDSFVQVPSGAMVMLSHHITFDDRSVTFVIQLDGPRCTLRPCRISCGRTVKTVTSRSSLAKLIASWWPVLCPNTRPNTCSLVSYTGC